MSRPTPTIDLRKHYRGIFGEGVVPGGHRPLPSILSHAQQRRRKRRNMIARKSRAVNRRGGK